MKKRGSPTIARERPLSRSTSCPICDNEAEQLFTITVLKKHKGKVHRCPACGHGFFAAPFWLKEAYTSPIASLDVGLVSRNLYFKNITCLYLEKFWPSIGRCIDFAGGYGLFTRLMRDEGYDFYRQDAYCENIFAVGLDIHDLASTDRQFALATAFEVFEHFSTPRSQAAQVLKLADTVLFSTLLAPKNSGDWKEWWYLSPDTGQHINFYSDRSLQLLAKQLGATIYSNGRDLHLLTRSKHVHNPFPYIEKIQGNAGWRNIARRIMRKLISLGVARRKRHPLTDDDFRQAQARLVSAFLRSAAPTADRKQ